MKKSLHLPAPDKIFPDNSCQTLIYVDPMFRFKKILIFHLKVTQAVHQYLYLYVAFAFSKGVF